MKSEYLKEKEYDAAIMMVIIKVKNKAYDIWGGGGLGYDLSFLNDITWDWKKRGRASATVKASRRHISFNKVLFEENKETFLNTTVPHEIAHIIAWCIYGHNGHGKDWKYVMTRMGYKANRCHTYDVTHTAYRQKRFIFKCSCREHEVSTRTKNLIVSNNGRVYSCKDCRDELIFTGHYRTALRA